MSILPNYKIRTQLLIALLPLAVMFTVAALYLSIQMKRIHDWYSNLIAKNIKALRTLTVATALKKVSVNSFTRTLRNLIWTESG